MIHAFGLMYSLLPSLLFHKTWSQDFVIPKQQNFNNIDPNNDSNINDDENNNLYRSTQVIYIWHSSKHLIWIILT